jgi:hypothetical protein
MTRLDRAALRFALGALLLTPGGLQAASHREAPLTSIDRTADITDFYAFVSYDDPEKVTLILAVDPFLEPANGPNYFPFDDEILYAVHVDNDNDAVEDVSFEFRFTTEIRLPGVFTGYVGAGEGIPAPANSPAPVAPGTPLIPPAITALDGAGSEGLSLRQSYAVTLVRGSGSRAVRVPLANSTGAPLFAVPSNVGPRTMPRYSELVRQGIYSLGNGVRVFAGTSDDAFWIDLGATFDSLNFRVIPDTDTQGVSGYGSTGIPAVLTDAQDAANANFVSDSVSGYNVNTIALEIPARMLTRIGDRPGSDHAAATIGTWGTTARRRLSVRRIGGGAGFGDFRQVQRMANPLFNELLIGTGFKDQWSRSRPKDDAQFAAMPLDPLLARAAQAAYGGAFDIPAPPRLDLLPLVTYAPPIAAPGTPPGPVADLLRLNVGVDPTPPLRVSRLGLIGGDPAGFPNGRRVFDDVTDIALRVVVGGVLANDAAGNSLNRFPNNRLGDGVNINETSYRNSFPYVADAHDGRNRRHLDPGERGGGPVD